MSSGCAGASRPSRNHDRSSSCSTTIRTTPEDVFGHADYAAALAKVIAGARNGLTIGLFGPWGIGKTSVLEALARGCGRHECRDSTHGATRRRVRASSAQQRQQLVGLERCEARLDRDCVTSTRRLATREVSLDVAAPFPAGSASASWCSRS